MTSRQRNEHYNALGKYVPPSRRGMSDAQARVAGDSMPDRRQREDTAAIRVSNLSENVQEADLQVSASGAPSLTIISVLFSNVDRFLRNCSNRPVMSPEFSWRKTR